MYAPGQGESVGIIILLIILIPRPRLEAPGRLAEYIHTWALASQIASTRVCKLPALPIGSPGDRPSERPEAIYLLSREKSLVLHRGRQCLTFQGACTQYLLWPKMPIDFPNFSSSSITAILQTLRRTPRVLSPVH